MKKIELLLPAGNIEKMEHAISYGADAVYLGLADFSLRSMKAGEVISRENLVSAIQKAHNMGAKAYLTFNIFARNSHINDIQETIELIKDAKPDAIIFSDFGVYNFLMRELPDIPLHVSTQTNTLNFEAVKFWQKLGVKRVILARELSIDEIKEIKDKVPDIELETFVHGSQCMSFSGRCLLSDYMTKGVRKANQGGCAQPCRWSYKLLEEKRPNEYFEINENEHGSYMLNSKDLALIEYIPDLINAGIDSVKIEGRTKSVYYASLIAKTYKKAINACYSGEKLETDYLMAELLKVTSRGYTKGFFLGKPDINEYNYENNRGIATATFLGLIKGKELENYKVLIKNQINLGDTVEIVTPEDALTVTVGSIENDYGEQVDAGKTNQEVLISFIADRQIINWERAIIRTLGVENAV